nr:plastid transcriptionally active 5 [Tanacetum cinerariifolium]
MSSSSLPLTFTYLHPHHKPSKYTYSYLKTNLFSPSSKNPHICFTFSKNSPDYEREESRWLREEQRWLREEQRWLREQKRWEDEKEGLLNEIKSLRDEIEVLRNEGGNGGNLVKLLNVLKKEVSQIAESGSSGVPFVVEANAEDFEDVEVVKEVVEEVGKVVKEVEVKEVKEVKVNVDKKRVMALLRVGSEGDQVQLLQEALLKQGFYCGEEDEEFSCFSTGTERAVKTWQSSIGVPETGVMTVELLERLFMDSGFKESANGAAATSVTEVPEIPMETVKEDPKAYVSDDRVYLLGENRYEDSSRLKNLNSLTQTSSKGVVTTKCITCRGEGRLLCLEKSFGFGFLSLEVDIDSPLTMAYGGFFGAGNDIVSFRSMEIISDVVGLSMALSWTQRSAT